MHDAIPAEGTGMIEQERGSTLKGIMLFFEKGLSFAVCILDSPSGIAPHDLLIPLVQQRGMGTK